MAGGSHFLWILLLSCVFQASDNRHGKEQYCNSFKLHSVSKQQTKSVTGTFSWLLNSLCFLSPSGCDCFNWTYRKCRGGPHHIKASGECSKLWLIEWDKHSYIAMWANPYNALPSDNPTRRSWSQEYKRNGMQQTLFMLMHISCVFDVTVTLTINICHLSFCIYFNQSNIFCSLTVNYCQNLSWWVCFYTVQYVTGLQ